MAAMGNWTIEDSDAVALLTFARAPANFMDFGSMIDLGDLLEQCADAPGDVKVVVLAGGVDGFFINHAELDDLTKAGEGRATKAELGSWSRAVALLEDIPQPTIAAIDGLASGGGDEIALACTLRVGSERARLEQPEVPVGIIPGGGGTVRLSRLVGPGVAAEAIMTGRPFDAPEALRAGWLNLVLPALGFTDHALRWAAAIAEHPGPALHAAKRSIVTGTRMAFGDALALERELFTDLTSHLEAKEPT